MIEFETLAIKADTNDIHTNFLLKKNFKSNIIKTILEYPLIVAPETLKMVIISVRQGYESTESKHDYRTEMIPIRLCLYFELQSRVEFP